MSVPIVHILHSVSTHLEFLMKSPNAGSFHFSLPKKNVSRWLYCFVTTSPTQQGSTLPHLNWSENIYRQRLWSTHCHKVSQSFPKLIGPFVFLFSCADFELWFHLDIYIERLTSKQTKNSIIKHKQFKNQHWIQVMRDTSADSRYRVDITMTFTDNKITKCVFTAWDQTWV